MSENFLYSQAIIDNYNHSKQEIKSMATSPKRRVHTDLKKMLQQCYFVGSAKYGSNFIA